MKINSKVLWNGLLFTVCALGATAFTSCSNEDVQSASGSPQDDYDQVPVELTATVIESPLTALTRAYDGLNVSGFSTPYQSASVWIDDNANAYTHYTYSCTGSTNLTPPDSPKAYFPAGVTSVNVIAWYPATTSGATSFSVQTNQNSNDNYVKSDLMIAQKAQCSRNIVNKAWVVTKAQLNFEHVMSKVVLNVTPAYGVKVTAARLLNVKPSTTIGFTNNAVNTSVTLGEASGTAGTITMLESGSDTGTENAAATYSYAAVFPPQSIAAGNFVEIDVEYIGQTSTLTLALTGAKTFATKNAYTINASLGTIQADQTVSLTEWTGATGSVNVTVGDLTDPAKKATSGMDKNPLYYVAQYNLASIKDVDTGSGEAAATAFDNKHAVPGPVFSWADANTTASGGSAVLTNYHLPTFAEQTSVIPSDNASGNGTNIFAQNKTSASDPYIMTQQACEVKGVNVASGLKSYFLKVGALDYYAVRFVGDGSSSDYASAWHYKMVPGTGITIESYMLDTKPKNDAEAKKILAALPTSKEWAANSVNLSPEDAASGNILVRRFIPASGYKNGSSGVADQSVGTPASCWSATTVDGSKAFRWSISSDGGLGENTSAQTDGFCVRLFHD